MSVACPACTALLVILQVSASSGRRGVYLREPYEVKKSKHNVSITPVFHKDAGGAVWVGLCGWGSVGRAVKCVAMWGVVTQWSAWER